MGGGGASAETQDMAQGAIADASVENPGSVVSQLLGPKLVMPTSISSSVGSQ